MHSVRSGTGAPLLLVHGLGGSYRSWSPILDRLSRHREVIAIDLPGHGASPRLAGPTSMASLADALTGYLREHGLLGIDAVGSSMGARLVLELVRRGGILGGVVSLNPGGFWRGWERHLFFASTWVSIRLVRRLQPVMPHIADSPAGRTLLLQQLSPRPWRLPASLVLDEMRSYAATTVFDELLYDLAYGEEQRGVAAGTVPAPLVIGWGRRDRVCLRRQAARAIQHFPDARLHWFAGCGHFPHWDVPDQAAGLILRSLTPR